ncbi:MAG TPA: phosphoribosylglycinamide formyltransferase [Clostridiales bacterium]|jgi:phosphoribosylglycinamide formyltransferase-1|nr:phosphoribosylglycinamide formyltransferase [Clostridiales bacterium]
MPPIRIAVLISGSGSNLQSIIDKIEKKEIYGELVLVVSNKRNAYGLERAKKHNIESLMIDSQLIGKDDYNRQILEAVIEKNVELVILAGYLKILDKKFIEAYRNRIINIHPSLIPSFCGKGYYGLKVHQSAVDYGVKISGATVHFVDEEADNGPIILQESVAVDFDDTPETLQSKVLAIEHELLPEAIKLYCDGKLEVIGRKVSISK